MAAIRHRMAANGPDCAKMRLTFHCFFHLSSCFQTENLLWPDCQSRFFYRLKNGAVAKRKWSNSPVFCGKVVLCSILGYKLLKSLSPKGKNGTAKLGFSGEERSSFLHFPVVKKSILFSGERDDFSAVPVAVWPSTFSGQRPGRAGTVPVRYWSCPA